MGISVRNTISYIFTIVCMVVVGFMIGFWFYKYKVEDRDIGVVDYVFMAEDVDIKTPVASLCFDNPFVERKLKEIDLDIDADSYLKYLKGEYFDERYDQIDFENVTIDLIDYFLVAEEIRRNESELRNSSLGFDHKVVFSGFYHGYFLKCFLLNHDMEKHRYIKSLFFTYDLFKLIDEWKSDLTMLGRAFWIKIHYPGQFMLGGEPVYEYIENAAYADAVVTELEVLKRRRNQKRKCYEGSEDYDTMIMRKHTLQTKCRAPYVNSPHEFPKCNTMEKINQSRFEYRAGQKMKLPSACERISKLEIGSLDLGDGESEDMTKWWFGITYPNEARIITQSKEVDIHSLIGNIGGYLGLFMGYALIQIPGILFSIYDYMKRCFQQSTPVTSEALPTPSSFDLQKSVHAVINYEDQLASWTVKEKLEMQSVLAWHMKMKKQTNENN